MQGHTMLRILPWMLLFGLTPDLHAQAATTVDLSGEWRFAIDRQDSGLTEKWFDRELADRITLPGILQAQGYGDEISADTPWVLSLGARGWQSKSQYQAYL